MSIYSSYQEPEDKTGTMHIINPSIEEFNTTFLDDRNKHVSLTLAPLESREFSRSVGSIVLRHLVNFILNQSGFSYKTDVNKELERIRATCIIYE